jgi:hypothetical protein
MRHFRYEACPIERLSPGYAVCKAAAKAAAIVPIVFLSGFGGWRRANRSPLSHERAA